jgi:hypothetical protein
MRPYSRRRVSAPSESRLLTASMCGRMASLWSRPRAVASRLRLLRLRFLEIGRRRLSRISCSAPAICICWPCIRTAALLLLTSLALLDQLALVGMSESSSRSSNGTSCGPYIFASSASVWNCSWQGRGVGHDVELNVHVQLGQRILVAEDLGLDRRHPSLPHHDLRRTHDGLVDADELRRAFVVGDADIVRRGPELLGSGSTSPGTCGFPNCAGPCKRSRPRSCPLAGGPAGLFPKHPAPAVRGSPGSAPGGPSRFRPATGD